MPANLYIDRIIKEKEQIMAILWQENLETGLKIIDDQHKELFHRFNKLLEACNAGQGRDEVMKVILYLDSYIRTHFADEEALQLRYGYPGYPDHRVLHVNFIKTVEDLEKQFKDEGANVSLVIQTNMMMVNWLTQHIGRMDREFARYMQTQPIK